MHFFRNRFGRIERIALTIAFVWGAALLVAAPLAPVYETSGVSSSGDVATGSATLVAVNGWLSVLVVAAPLAAALIIGGLLWRRAGRPGAGVLAWVVAGLIGCFNLLAMLSIGVFILPVTVALLVACGSHGHGPRGAVNRSGAAS